MKNSKTKKILSILLALVMLVGMIPATSLTVHAYSTITDIDVNITEPVVGQYPDSKGTVNNSEKYEVRTVSWSDAETGDNINGERFISGRTYKARVVLNSYNAEFHQDKIKSIKVNGIKMPLEIIYSVDKILANEYRLELHLHYTMPGPKYSKYIEIDGTRPTVNQTPKYDYTLSNMDTSEYEIYAMEWRDRTAGGVMESTDKFIAGHSYDFKMEIRGIDDNTFLPVDELIATVNGVVADCYSVSGEGDNAVLVVRHFKIRDLEGSGTKDDPYVVYDEDDFLEAVAFDDVYVKLGSNINFSEYTKVFVDVTLDLNNKVLTGKDLEFYGDLSLKGPGEIESDVEYYGDSKLSIDDAITIKVLYSDGQSVVLNHPEAYLNRITSNKNIILEEGTLNRLLDYHETTFIMRGGIWKGGVANKYGAGLYKTNYALYGGRIDATSVDAIFSGIPDLPHDDLGVGDIFTYLAAYGELLNSFCAFSLAGEVKKCTDMDDFISAAKEYGAFDVYAPYFAEQFPEMPAGQTTHNLGKVSSSEYVMTFASQDTPSSLGVSGYKVIEQLVVYDRDNNGKIVDTVTNNPQLSGTGISYSLKNLPSGNYTIRESITLYDKDGKAVLGNNNDFILEVDGTVNNINVSATFSGTPAKATSNTDGITVTSTKWYKKNGSSWTQLGASDTIKEGNTYRCEVTVGATGTYTLADGYTVKINGIAATKKSGNTWYRDVTITGYSDYVDVHDVDLPEAYTNPDFTYNDEEGTAYHWDVVQVEWFECDKDGKKLSGALTEYDVFQKDTYYRVEVTVVPETNWQFHGSQLSVYINGKAANYIYGYNKAYPDSVTGYVVYNTADIEGNNELYVYNGGKDIYIKDGQYLGSNATGATATKPASGGYAYYKDGVLELNGYKNEKAHFIFEELALELYLVGDNTIGAIYDNEWGMAGGNLETRQGNLVIDAADGGKLTIASNPLDAFANIQVKDLYFNGGELTSCLANGTYGAAVQLNGGNLYLEDGYVAYVSDTNDFASATKWDRTTDISDYDCVWIVEKQETILNVNLSSYLGKSDFITLALYDKNMDIPYYHYTLRGNTTSYSFPAVPYGEYVIVAEKPGHVPYQCTIVAEDDALYQDVELNLYADTNFNGEIDVQDYQALINVALSDDHEQIETEEYDDLIHYDIDGDGYLDAIDAAFMALIVNGHKTIDEVYDLKKGDYDYDGEAYTENDLIAMYHVLSDIDSSAPTLSTSQKFASDLNYNGKVDEGDLAILTGRYGTIEATTCEENIKVYYRWGNSYTTCTATAICTICDKHVAKETVNSVKNADGSFTATFTNTLLGTKTFKKQ